MAYSPPLPQTHTALRQPGFLYRPVFKQRRSRDTERDLGLKEVEVWRMGTVGARV